MVYTYISNQGFAGGFDCGMTQAGLKLIHKVEMKESFGLQNCLGNRDILGHDWTYQASDPREWNTPNSNVIVGNPPCSGWSVMSNKDFRGGNSPILSCTWAFVEYVARVQPEIAVFESVQQAFTSTDGLKTMRKLHAYVEDKTSQKWSLYHIRHNAYSVGGPAQRKRYFWLISRIPFGIEIPTITMYPTLNDVIGDLADLNRTWDLQPYQVTSHPYAQQFISPSGYVDGCWYVNGNPPTQRLHDLMKGTRWGPGEAIAVVARRHYEEHGKLPDSFAATEQKIVSRDFSMGFTTPSRWDGNKHGRVITGGALQQVIHPFRDRMITHREAARILGFPDDWRIEPIRYARGLQQTWGKGITTHCGRWIGEWIHRALDGNPGSYTGNIMYDNEYDIDVTHAWLGGRKKTLSQLTKFKSTRSIMKTTSAMSYTRIYNEGNVMTEPTNDSTSTGTRRGRPRPRATIERDENVFSMLTQPMSRQELSDATGLPKNEVYLSLYRLAKVNRVYRGRIDGRHVWYATETPSDASDQTLSETLTEE